MTWVELLIVVVTLGVVTLLLLPMLAKSKPRSKRINCVSNLKQIGLAARVWSDDHKARFPWTVSTNEGGTLEYAESAVVFRHFEVMSNELAIPNILTCSSDSERLRARGFSPGLANSNVSYFVGLDADERFHERWLFGDRNVTGGVTTTFGLLYLPNSVPGWDETMHNWQGNLALADGSVQQTSADLPDHFRRAFASLTNMEMRVAIPRVPGE